MNIRPRIFVTSPIPDDLRTSLAAEFDAHFWNSSDPVPAAELSKELQVCKGILTNLNDKLTREVVLQANPDLRVISNLAVGYNNIDVTAATARKVAVCNTPGVLTDATANTALALLLAVTRRVVEGDSCIRQGRWKGWSAQDFIGYDLGPHTVVGIVGFGRIGQAFARKCNAAFQCRIRYFNKTRKPEFEAECGGAQFCSQLPELLSSSDIVSIHLDLNPTTAGLFSEAAFAHFKPGGILINTARGEIVDEAALFTALASGQLWGAGLDVFSPEPPAPNNPLLKLNNVVVTPHLGSATKETRYAMAKLAVENLRNCLWGEAPRYCINSEVLQKRD